MQTVAVTVSTTDKTEYQPTSFPLWMQTDSGGDSGALGTDCPCTRFMGCRSPASTPLGATWHRRNITKCMNEPLGLIPLLLFLLLLLRFHLFLQQVVLVKFFFNTYSRLSRLQRKLKKVSVRLMCLWRSVSFWSVVAQFAPVTSIHDDHQTEIQTHERFKRTLFIRTKHNLRKCSG